MRLNALSSLPLATPTPYRAIAAQGSGRIRLTSDLLKRGKLSTVPKHRAPRQMRAADRTRQDIKNTGAAVASLFELLKAVKPSRVLLTTYTFSTEWFEATVYPLLTKQGCEQISVILDNREARSSISQSASRYGGNGYRIMSVLPRSNDAAGGEQGGVGIFHPKIAYLETEDDDIALVASGNLTAAGQGHQMEVLDVVKASLEPEVFGELSGFFRDLPSRLNLLSHEDRRILAAFSNRAAQQAGRHRRRSGARTAWLITTLHATAGEQFASLASEQRQVADSLTVLSPFHDEDVAAITRLRKRIGAERIRLGLGKSRAMRSEDGRDWFIAPFSARVKPLKGKLEFVTPPLSREERPRKIHAKWFELGSRSGAALLLTGSVNATPQSLWSLKNIEVSLARHLAAPVAGKWPQVRSSSVIYQPCVYPAPDAPDDALNCSARIVGRSDRLSLEVLFSATPPTDSVHIRLSQEEGDTLLASDVSVNADDTVKVSLKAEVRKKLDERAVWLTVSSKDSSATVWVNVEVELSRRPGDLDLQKAFEHFKADDSDENLNLLFATEFLGILGTVDTPAVPGTPKSPETPGTTGLSGKKKKAVQRLSTDDGDIVITAHDWLDSVRAKRKPSAASSSVMEQLSRVISHLMKTLDAPIADPGQTSSEDDGDEDDIDEGNDDQSTKGSSVEEAEEGNADEDSEGDETEVQREKAKAGKRKKRQEARLERRLKSILEVVDRLLARTGSLALPDPLVCLLLPIRLNYSLSGSRFPASGVSPANAARELLSLRRGELSLQVREQLRPFFACVGVVIATAYASPERPAFYREIRSHLEGLGGAVLNQDELKQWVEDGVRDQRLRALSRFTSEALAQAVAGIAAAQPLERRIADLVLDALTAPSEAEAPAHCTPEEKEMFETLRRRAREGRKPLFSVTIGDGQRHNVGCPKCFQGLKESNSLLRTQMLVSHLNCDQPVFLRKTAYADLTFECENRAYVKRLDGAPFKAPQSEAAPHPEGSGDTRNRATFET